MNILVTGGAGYIGSITTKLLVEKGHHPVIFDALTYRDASQVKHKPFIHGHTSDYDLVTQTLREHKIDAVIHFAAYIEAGESMQNPAKYFENNYYGTLMLLKAMQEVGVDKLVFSSTAAV